MKIKTAVSVSLFIFFTVMVAITAAYVFLYHEQILENIKF